MMNLIELGTAIWFEHENHHIFSKYLLHLYSLTQGAGSVWYNSREGIVSSASIHSIIGDRKGSICFQLAKQTVNHLFSQNLATNTENSAESRSEHIFMELTLFVYNIDSQYFCIKSGLNYLRYKRYKRNETEGHIFFCNLNFHRNGMYILYIDCYHHRKIYFTSISCFIIYWTLLDHNLPY